jgi:hypothetical protein
MSRAKQHRASTDASFRRVGLSGLALGVWGLFRSPPRSNDEQGPPEIVGVDATRCPAGHENLPGAEFCTTCGAAIDPTNPVQYREPTPTLSQAYAGVARGLLFIGDPVSSSQAPEIVGHDAVYCPRNHPNVPGASVCSTCRSPLES